MRKILYLSALLILLSSFGFSQVDLIGNITKSAGDTTLYTDISSGSRGCWVADDIDGDGRPELITTDYSGGGRVHVYEAVDDSTVELIWSSPKQASTIGAGASPRSVRVGDLDNDGLKEIIFPTNNGYYIYEWDGVTGSGNYGTMPSQILNGTNVSGLTNTINRNEYFDVVDIDGDGVQELVTVWNDGSSATRLYLAVFEATGNWDTDSPGFSGFNLDYSIPSLGILGGGQPIAAFVGDLNGDGQTDILVHTWNFLNVFPVSVNGTNYSYPDTASGKQNLQILANAGVDGVALLGGVITDIDNDDAAEVYLPVYASSTEDNADNGDIFMVSYDKGDDISQIDESKAVLLTRSPSKELAGNTKFSAIVFGGDWADMNNDGQKELYFGSTTPADVIELEYTGGDKKDPNNWKSSIAYNGIQDIYTTVTIKDSLGVIDTIKTKNTPFASKIYGKNMDFNGNGKRDLLVPYQGLRDSLTYTWQTYVADSSKFVTDSTSKLPHPAIYIARLLESTGSTGLKEINVKAITPDNYQLDQNYPNPFNPTTSIRFTLPVTKQISLKVFDILGSEVKTLLSNEEIQKGAHEVVWDGTNNSGQKVSSGQYICTLKYGNFAKSIKMTLLK